MCHVNSSMSVRGFRMPQFGVPLSGLFRFGGVSFRQRRRFGQLFAPRKPRALLLRITFALIGIAVLALLLVMGLMLGTVMIATNLAVRLWRQRGKPIANTSTAIDGEYRVLHKSALPNGQ